MASAARAEIAVDSLDHQEMEENLLMEGSRILTKKNSFKCSRPGPPSLQTIEGPVRSTAVKKDRGRWRIQNPEVPTPDRGYSQATVYGFAVVVL